MTEHPAGMLMQQSVPTHRAPVGMSAGLIERPRRTARRKGFIIGASAVAGCAVLMAILTFRPAAPPPAVPGDSSAVVTGQLMMVGGPAPGVRRPVAGTIEVHRGTATDGPVVASQRTGTDGRFSLAVPVGTYAFTGNSSIVDGGRSLCISDPTVVPRSGATADIVVYCQIK